MRQWRTLFLAAVLTVVWAGQASSEGNRRYSKLSDEEANRIISGIIQKKEPRIQGLHTMDSWSLPKDKIVARGLKVDDEDYVVWAAAQPKNVLRYKRFYLLEKGASNIPEGVEEAPFVLNGIFVTSVDLKVLGNPSQIIKRGGYEWWAGPYGVILAVSGVFIFFQDPLKDFSLSPPVTIHVIEFSLLPKPDSGFAVHIKDKIIQFK